METINTNGVEIRSWCPNIEESALNQMKVIAELPYTKECCLMPDAHFGMKNGMPVGGVIALDGVVVPNAVGVDIGCGMCALKTNLKVSDLNEVSSKELFNKISRNIPVGHSHNTDERRKFLEKCYMDKFTYIMDKSGIKDRPNPIGDIQTAFFSQLGTLGGGNHFCEVQVDEAGSVWVMIHSGSRNIGKRIGDCFNDLATELNAKWFSEKRIIPFLPVDTDEGQDYIAWMDFALRFAFLNRIIMMDAVKDALERTFNDVEYITKNVVEDSINDVINIHHNFAALECHHGKNVWVHRKGATRAFEGMTGIIPGSMGTHSYIVKGLGNHQSLMSCSHGAGRKMGRKVFSRQMQDNYAEIEKSLEGVIHSEFGNFPYGKDKGLKDVSEAPGAYKNIDEVIENELDLVKVLVKLSPKICVKG
ncbi:MAG: RtcB family protein [Synergistaceae bacterium]